MNENLVNLLIAPHVSEKSARLQELGQYVFEVAQYATKYQVKEAVENLFGVEVNSVNLVQVKGRVKSFRFKPGIRKGWRKAYVALKAGHTIDMTDKL